MNRAFLLIILAVLVGGCISNTESSPPQDEAIVFAAASLRDVLSDVGSAFRQRHKEKVHFNFAGSNVLAQQIVASAQADMYISANQHWMDHVEKKGRIDKGTRKTILANRIVVVAHKTTTWKMTKPEDLVKIQMRYLSMANPEGVPAGRYAKAYLEKVPYGDGNLWTVLQPLLAPAPDVRAALSVVEADPSIVGIVYRTDAVASSRVRIVFEIPEGEVPPIRYAAARIPRPNASPVADTFYAYLFGRDARHIFSKHGFIPLKEENERVER